MNIVITTKNLELTDQLNGLINKKISGLKKFTKILKTDFQEVFIEVEKETRHHRKGDVFKAEAIITLPGRKLVARSHGENLSQVIIAMRDELKREIRKYKTQTVELPRRKYRKLKKQTF